MAIENARYVTPANDFVDAVFDGNSRTVPVDTDNPYYQRILNDNVQIAAFVASSTKAAVDQERDRRLSTFPFEGHVYQFDAKSRARIASAGMSALGAIIDGAQPNDYRWSNAADDFGWIDRDNVTVKMDAQTAWNFAQAAELWKQQHALAARKLKDMTPIPANVASDDLWPDAS